MYQDCSVAKKGAEAGVYIMKPLRRASATAWFPELLDAPLTAIKLALCNMLISEVCGS
jgi:hypothetical protein